MEDFTKSCVVFAFFERNGRKVEEDSLRMIPLTELMPAQNRKVGISYDEKSKSLKIPRYVMYSGFELFQQADQSKPTGSQRGTESARGATSSH